MGPELVGSGVEAGWGCPSSEFQLSFWASTSGRTCCLRTWYRKALGTRHEFLKRS